MKPTYTNQQLFNKVATHLLRQGKQALAPGGEGCRYRGDQGTKCAVGCLIKDEDYDYAIEGQGILVNNLNGIQASSLLEFTPTDDQLNLLDKLQAIHDSAQPPEWCAFLRDFAHRHGLDTACLEAAHG